jgi:hypothetical protein
VTHPPSLFVIGRACLRARGRSMPLAGELPRHPHPFVLRVPSYSGTGGHRDAPPQEVRPPGRSARPGCSCVRLIAATADREDRSSHWSALAGPLVALLADDNDGARPPGASRTVDGAFAASPSRLPSTAGDGRRHRLGSAAAVRERRQLRRHEQRVLRRVPVRPWHLGCSAKEASRDRLVGQRFAGSAGRCCSVSVQRTRHRALAGVREASEVTRGTRRGAA